LEKVAVKILKLDHNALVKSCQSNFSTATTTLMVSLIGAGATSCGDRGAYSCIKRVKNSKSTRVTDAKRAKVKQWLHDFLSHPWVDCKEPAHLATAPTAGGRARRCEFREDQLGRSSRKRNRWLSKIRDRSTGNGRPHRTAVFDF